MRAHSLEKHEIQLATRKAGEKADDKEEVVQRLFLRLRRRGSGGEGDWEMVIVLVTAQMAGAGSREGMGLHGGNAMELQGGGSRGAGVRAVCAEGVGYKLSPVRVPEMQTRAVVRTHLVQDLLVLLVLRRETEVVKRVAAHELHIRHNARGGLGGAARRELRPRRRGERAGGG